MPENRETIYGVDREVLDRFVRLFKEKYRAVDNATLFLENHAGISGTNVTIANQRDVASHFVTLLTQDLKLEDQWAQLHSAEEHLRRAITEPYELAVIRTRDKVERQFEAYQKLIIPIANEPGLQGAPSPEAIQAKLKEITEHSTRGRRSKTANLWDRDFENTIKEFTVAFDKLEALRATMDRYLINARQIREEKENTRRYRINIGIAIAVGVVGVIISYFLGRYF